MAVDRMTVLLSMQRALWEQVTQQDMRRGDWPTKRTSRMPDPPLAEPRHPMLAALLHDARTNIAAGMTTDIAVLQLATHCYFEGYDRGLCRAI
ncbi:MAG: hypothetical protein ABWY81_00010 [Jiangellaceae bacterium]